jgi:glycosyltransferase involved in cell wall biosynthesis
MKVLHVISGLAAGGAEQWLRLLLRHGPADAEVLTLSNPGLVADALRAEGVRVTSLGMRGNRDLSVLPRLRRHIRAGGFDVVHTHLFRAQLYGALAARLAGVRTVVSTEHSLNDRLIEGRPTDRFGVRELYRLAARLTSVTIAVSEPVADRLVAWGIPRARIEVVPVGLDVQAFRFDPRARLEIRRELGVPTAAMVVGGVGRLVEPKRFDVLVRALPDLPGVYLLLVGDGPERKALGELAARNDVADRVIFTGERLDVGRLLAAMDVFASPSPEETFGVAILEALAAGLPVVYADCPALLGHEDTPDVVRTDVGPGGYAAVLAGLLTRASDRASRASSRVVDHYDGAVLAGTMNQIYRRGCESVDAHDQDAPVRRRMGSESA